MNSYQSLRKQNNSSAAAAFTLAVCVALSAVMLFSRLTGFTPADTRHYIPLTESSGITTVREGRRQSDGNITFRHAGYHFDSHRLLAAQPNLKVYDENTVWAGDTAVEIFKVSYANGSSQITVQSSNGDKVIAPGTNNTYIFGLDNTGNVALDYSVTVNAVCEIIGKDLPSGQGTSYEIPVNAAVSYTRDAAETYLFGAAGNNEPIVQMVNVTHSGSVGAGKYIPFTLYWEWPFESGNDALDTFLGNEAAGLELDGQEIRLTITIQTVAEYSADPNADDGVPNTGDDGIGLAVIMMVASTAGLILLLIPPRRKRRESND